MASSPDEINSAIRKATRSAETIITKCNDDPKLQPAKAAANGFVAEIQRCQPCAPLRQADGLDILGPIGHISSALVTMEAYFAKRRLIDILSLRRRKVNSAQFSDHVRVVVESTTQLRANLHLAQESSHRQTLETREQSARREAQFLKDQIRDLQEKLRSESDAHSNSMNKLRTKRDEAKRLSRQNEQLQAETRGAEQKYSEAVKKLEQHEKIHKDRELADGAKIESLTAQLETARSNLKRIEEEKVEQEKSLKDKVRILKATNKHLVIERGQARETESTLTAQVQDLQIDVQNLHNDKEKLAASKEELDGAQSQALAKQSKLEEDVRSKAEEIQGLMARLNIQTQELREAKASKVLFTGPRPPLTPQSSDSSTRNKAPAFGYRTPSPTPSPPRVSSEKVLCPTGSRCRRSNPSCPNLHPSSLCWWGKDCFRRTCNDEHPQIGACLFGRSCSNIRTCRYRHTERPDDDSVLVDEAHAGATQWVSNNYWQPDN